MNVFYYVQSIIDLSFFNKEKLSTQVVDFIDKDKIDALKCKHLFFDIDDTLNHHGLGLEKEQCSFLDTLSVDYKIVLLTNCSQKRKLTHLSNLEKYSCKAELWEVGKKPNHSWLKAELDKRKWEASECAFFGDRPTMDLWMSFKLNFKERVHVVGFYKKNKKKGIIALIRKVETWLIR